MASRPKRDYREVRLYAAHRHAGAKWWKWYVIYEPLLRRFGLPVLAVVVLWAAWLRVPHATLGVITLVLAGLLAVGAFVYQFSDRALQRAMDATTKRGAGLGFAVTALVAVLGFASWAALWSPYA
jgi:hypothetical protein